MLFMTHHAQSTLQQRGIPLAVVENLLDFGHEAHDHRGSQIVYFDHHAREQLRWQVGSDRYKRLERHLGAYAVVGGDGSIITVGHRTHRINRN